MAYNRVCKSTVSQQGIDFTMSRNIEIKARISNMEEMHKKVADLADQGPIEILQDDTFFSCPNGRLKLRILSEDEGQLIFYRRQDKSGPKESFYVILKN
jgi:adenylate cyclase class IV